MSDQFLGLLIPAITAVLVALIGAFVTITGQGRDRAVYEALRAKDEQIRRLTESQEDPDDAPPTRRRRRAP